MKWVMFFIVTLFLVPFVSADIYINQFSQDKYNLGDKIGVSGYIIENKDVRGILNLNLICEEDSYPLIPISVSLKANEKKVFTHDSPIYYGDGYCYIKASLTNLMDNKLVEEKVTDSFQVTKDLDGNFNLLDNKIRLGEYFTLTGTVFRLNGVNVEGLAIIYFKKDGEVYFVNSEEVKVVNGEVKYEIMADSLPAGNYDIDVYIRDDYGNEKLFGNVADLEISNELIISADLAVYNVKPGDIIKLSGSVSDFENKYISDAIIDVEINEQKYEMSLNNGFFEGEIKLMDNIKSGENDIKISSQDKYGNYGEKILKVNVEAIPTKFDLTLNELNYNPEDVIEASVLLYDQAGDFIEGRNANIILKDPKDKKILERTVLTGEKSEIELDKLAKPGRWSIEASFEKFDIKKDFIINKIRKIDVSLTDQIVTLTNIGNVDYEGIVKFDLGGGNLFEENVNLNVGASKDIELFKEIKDGDYELIVYADQEEFDLGSVSILDPRSAVSKMTGAVVGGGGLLGMPYIIIVFLLLIIAYIPLRFKYKKRDKYSGFRKERDIKEGKKRVKEILDERSKGKRRRTFVGSEVKEEDAKAFRESVLKTIEEDKQKKGSIFKSEDDYKDWGKR